MRSRTDMHVSNSDWVASGTRSARQALAQHLGLVATSTGINTDRFRAEIDPAGWRDALARLGLDGGRVPHASRLGALRVAAFDMDSTLITIECVDEIADFVGKKAEVAAITEASMRGEIADFRESLTRRVALLAGIDARVLERVYQERLALSPGVESLMRGLARAGVRTLVVSGGFTFFTERLKRRLDLDFAHANTLEIVDGRLTGRVVGEFVDARGKAEALLSTCARVGVPPSAALAVGDGANDLVMMSTAGMGIAYRAKPVVTAAADACLAHAGLDLILDWLDARSG